MLAPSMMASMLSREFRYRLKFGGQPAYRIAQKAEVDPSTLSKLLRGAVPLKPRDPRVIAVGRILGLRPAECFQD
jgi:hypothetical protein